MTIRHTITVPRQPQQRLDGFVAVRALSGRLLGYYNPQTHQWLYDDGKQHEVVDLPEPQTQRAATHSLTY